MIKKKLLSLLLVFAMLMGMLPFGEISAYAGIPDPDKAITITRMVLRDEYEREEGGNPKLLSRKIQIMGGEFDRSNISIDYISIKKENGEPVKIDGENPSNIDANSIEVELLPGGSLEENTKYKVSVDYKKDGDLKIYTAEKDVEIKDIISLTKIIDYTVRPDEKIKLEGQKLTGKYIQYAVPGPNQIFAGTTLLEDIVENGNTYSGGTVPSIAPGIKDIRIHNGTTVNEDSATHTITLRESVQILQKESNLKVSRIYPRVGPEGGNDIVTIEGKGFYDGMKVEFGEGNISSEVKFSSKDGVDILTVKTPAKKDSDRVKILLDELDTGFEYSYVKAETLISISSVKGINGMPEGSSDGKESIQLVGKNFQIPSDRTGNKWVTGETDISLDSDKKKLTFIKKIGDNEQTPDFWPEDTGGKKANLRKRILTVRIGGYDATFDLEIPSNMTDPEKIELLNSLILSGDHILNVITPKYPIPEPTPDKPNPGLVDIVLTAKNEYYYYEDKNNNGAIDEGELKHIEDTPEPEAKHPFTYKTFENPKIDEDSIVVKEGPVELVGKEEYSRMILEIIGSNFLVQKPEGKETQIPKFYLVPRIDKYKDSYILKETIEYYNEDKAIDEDLKKYEANIKDEAIYIKTKEGTTTLSGTKSEKGNKVNIVLPSIGETDLGLMDLVVINPDGGIYRAERVFEYKPRIDATEEQGIKIVSASPSKVDPKGGQEVTIKVENINLEDKYTVTVDGMDVGNFEVDTITGEIKFKAPADSPGKKIIQIVVKNESGKYWLHSYNYKSGTTITAGTQFEYITDNSNPKITEVKPKTGGTGTRMYIFGQGFDKNAVVYLNIPGSIEDSTPINIIQKETHDPTMIEIDVPSGLMTGLKDVKVLNPKGSSATLKNGFYYTNPPGKINPTIENITPPYAVKGVKMNVAITGTGFKPNATVLFGGREAKVLELSPDGKRMKVEVPEFISAGEVDVAIYNTDTGFAIKTKGFKYLNAITQPKISKIYNLDTGDATGSTGGGQRIRIEGEGFVKVGDDLPTVYFGGEEAKIFKDEIAWSEEVVDGGVSTGVLLVELPKYPKAEAVDVIVTNPEKAAGIAVAKDGFTYKSSEPKITNVYESIIPKNGGREIYIEGSGFMKSPVPKKDEDKKYYNTASPSKGEKVEMEIEVQFGAESKSEDIFGSDANTLQMDNFDVIYYPTGKKNSSGNGIEPMPEGKYKGKSVNVEVVKKGEGFETTDSSGNVSAHIEPGEPLYASLRTSGTAEISEGIKVEVDGDKLIATRQMAIKATVNTEKTQITVKTPPMLKLGKDISLTVTNIDGGTASWKGLEVKNPASKPRIVDIDEDNKGIVRGEKQEIIAYRVTSGVNGGKPFSIKVTDFADGALVRIGGQKYEQGKGYEVASREGGSTVWLKITPAAAKPEDIGKQLPIMLTNPDGGPADSKADISVGNPKKPAYFFYQDSDSNPVITSIDPSEGPTVGGQKVTITGSGFKYPYVEVTFGGVKAELDPDPGPGKEQSSTTLHVLTPPADSPGEVEVFVENTKEYGMSNSVKYKYKASPLIIKIVPNVVRSIGGEKVEIIGKGFEEGATVKIGEEELPAESVKFVDQFKIEILTPKVELPNGVDELKKDVTVTNPNGESDTKKDGITFIRPFPMKPTGFEATAKPGRTILLKWDERILDDDESKIRPRYRIEISDSENGPFKHLGEVEDSISSYLVRDLEPDKKYYFRLWALNQYGQSLGFAEANATTLKPGNDSQDGEFEDDTETESQVLESGGNITVNYSKKYTTEDYAHDFTAVKYTNYRTITLNIPAAVVNKSGNGILSLKHRDFEIKSALSTLKSGEREYKDGEILQVKITKLFGGEQSTALKYVPAGYTAQNQGVKIEYTVGSGANNTALESVKGMIFAVYVDKPSLSDLGHYSYKPGEMAAVREKSVYSRVYSDVQKKEVYKLDSNVKRSGYYIAFGK